MGLITGANAIVIDPVGSSQEGCEYYHTGLSSANWEPDYTGCRTHQEKMDHLAQCMQNRNSLNFAAFRCGELLGNFYRSRKASVKRAEDPRVCESRRRFHLALNKVEFLSVEYFNIINRCRSENVTTVDGLHRLSPGGLKELVGLMEQPPPHVQQVAIINADFITSLTAQTGLRNYYFRGAPSSIPIIQLVYDHGSLSLFKEMIDLYPVKWNFFYRQERTADHRKLEKLMEVIFCSPPSAPIWIINRFVEDLVLAKHYLLFETFVGGCVDRFGADIIENIEYFEDAKIVKILLDYGFAPDKGKSPLEWAASWGMSQFVESLLKECSVIPEHWVVWALEIARRHNQEGRFFNGKLENFFHDAFGMAPVYDYERVVALLEQKMQEK